MADIIHILPDAVANQIAAGEVIQRPASVLKELVENAIDAKSTQIHLVVKDAGKTLIQVIDDGLGMSETDARLAFERHATSKIKQADDLFSIYTFGFRGEALPSIVSVSQVELRSRRKSDELGTFIYYSASEVVKQEPVNCQVGTNISVFNLFFNVPARRKFLKTNSTELKHILNEFFRVALAYPQIGFSLNHNGSEIYNVPISNIKQRIVHIFGKNINQSLTTIEVNTGIVKISGFIGKPEFAKKSNEEQFFFVNNRFIRQAYFHKAIMLAYDQVLPPETSPSYFIYFEIDPKLIDVNIHPTKTEINFEDAGSIFLILRAAAKEALGKFNVVPSIDFDQSGAVPIPILKKNTDLKYPIIHYNEGYNPFATDLNKQRGNDVQKEKKKDAESFGNWEKLYSNFESDNQKKENSNEEQLQTLTPSYNEKFFQFKNRYILTPVKSGLMIVNQRRAHERILYENLLASIKTNGTDVQRLLYPLKMDLNAGDYAVLSELKSEIAKAGFDFEFFGKDTVVVNGIPAILGECDAKQMVEKLIEHFKNINLDMKPDLKDRIAKSVARTSAINYGRHLNLEEMRELIDNLFACQTPNFSPDGKKIITIITHEEIDKKFT